MIIIIIIIIINTNSQALNWPRKQSACKKSEQSNSKVSLSQWSWFDYLGWQGLSDHLNDNGDDNQIIKVDQNQWLLYW